MNLLNLALQHANQVVSHDFLIVVITDFRWANVDTIKKIIRLSRNNDVIAAQVIDPMEAKLPGTRISVSDGEFQTLVEKNTKVHRLYEQSYEEQQNWLMAQFKKYGVPHVQLNTVDTVSAQLRKLVGGQIQIRKRR